MQASLDYRINQDLFSNHYLEEHLPQTEDWDKIDKQTLEQAFQELKDIYNKEKNRVEEYNESSLERHFIRPILENILNISFEIEETVKRGQRRPDYAFFQDEKTRQQAFDKKQEGKDFYEDAIAIADAKRWNRKLDTRGKKKRDFENPSHQIHVYLQETPTDWALLTNGKKWRLYYTTTSHRLDSYYEIDLPTLIQKNSLEDFKYFYLFFHKNAYTKDQTGESFLDKVYNESNIFAQELGEDLQDNIYEAIKILSEGFLKYQQNNLDKKDLDLIHDSSLIYLYRIIFILYAESEGRNLLNTDNKIYRNRYSLNTLKQEIAQDIDSSGTEYYDWSDSLWDRLDELFTLIDKGSQSMNINKEDLYIPAYNGGLFRTDPSESDSKEAKFLQQNKIGDNYLAQVIDLLTRRQNNEGKVFVDYSSLDIRHLGSIYEGLLEYQLNVAEKPLAIKDGKYTTAEENDEIIVEEGDVYLTTDSGERKATGSYYTLDYIVEYIVENTLDPLVDDIKEDLLARDPFDSEKSQFAEEFAEQIFELNVLDPAMGSGHFLTSAVDFLARQIIDAQQRQAEQQGIETIDESHDINWARRQIAQRCIYGVDINPLAVELAKVSLWLRTLAAEQPLAFLDHHLKTGNSLIGSDIEEIDQLKETEKGNNGPNTTLTEFGMTRRGTIEHLMKIYQEFITIENRERVDVKEMEEKYDEIKRNKLRKRLISIANIYTSEYFGIEISNKNYKKISEGIKNDQIWKKISQQKWFQKSQEKAENKHFFHWKLEFPEVFYKIDGDKKKNPGFDAVIGNPPYGAELTEQDRKFLSKEFNTSKKYKNTGLQFIELCDILSKKNGIYGQIVPKPLSYSQKWSIGRNFILPNLKLAIDVSRAFEGVLYEQIIFVVDKKTKSSNYLTARGDERGFESTIEVKKQYCKTTDTLILNTKEKYLDIFQKINGDNNLGDISKTSRGLPYQKHRTDSGGNPVYGGKHISRYNLSSTNEYLKPEVIDDGKDKVQFVKQPKVISQRIVAHVTSPTDRIIIMSTLDKEGKLTLDTVENTVLTDEKYSLEFITALFNSSLFSWFGYEFIFSKAIRTMDFDNYYVSKFPLPNSYPADEFKDKVNKISSLEAEKEKINTNFKDYIGNYSNGKTLGDLYNPVDGLSDTILTDTTTDKENLKVGKIKFEEIDEGLILKASTKYKPENENEFDDLDRWGYTETDLIPAMKFSGSENKLALIQEFTKLAVDEAGGFAEFREKATKTNSVIDRLEKLKLPNLEDVESSLEKYLNQKEKAKKLEKEIQEIDNLVDAIIFNIYNLNEQESITILDSLGIEEKVKEDIIKKYRKY